MCHTEVIATPRTFSNSPIRQAAIASALCSAASWSRHHPCRGTGHLSKCSLAKGTILGEALSLWCAAANVSCEHRSLQSLTCKAIGDVIDRQGERSSFEMAQIVQWCAAAIYRKRSTMRKELSSHHHSRNGNNRKAISNLHKGALNLQSELAAILFLQSL